MRILYLLILFSLILFSCDPTMYDDPQKKRINPVEEPPEIDSLVYINNVKWYFIEFYNIDNDSPFDWQENFSYVRNQVIVDTTGVDDVFTVDMEVQPTSPDSARPARLDRVISFRVKLDSLRIGNVFNSLQIKKYGLLELKLKNLRTNQITTVSTQELISFVDTGYEDLNGKISSQIWIYFTPPDRFNTVTFTANFIFDKNY